MSSKRFGARTILRDEPTHILAVFGRVRRLRTRQYDEQGVGIVGGAQVDRAQRLRFGERRPLGFLAEAVGQPGVVKQRVEVQLGVVQPHHLIREIRIQRTKFTMRADQALQLRDQLAIQRIGLRRLQRAHAFEQRARHDETQRFQILLHRGRERQRQCAAAFGDDDLARASQQHRVHGRRSILPNRIGPDAAEPDPLPEKEGRRAKTLVPM